MAENAHDEHKSTSPGMKEAGELIFGIILFLIVLSYLIYHFGGGGGVSAVWPNIKDSLDSFIHETAFGRFLSSSLFVLKFIGTYVSLLFVIGIAAVVVKLTAVNKKDHHHYSKEVLPVKLLPEEDREKQKWQRIETHLAGDNASDWRLAILEADIMLEEVLEKKGYLGATLGEKLKNAKRGDFVTLDKAWEAHKIRNLIAHEGSNFLISEREAKRVIELFKDVFDEFHYL